MYRVLHIVDRLHFGGTEKAVEEFCSNFSSEVDPTVFAFKAGAREDRISNHANVVKGGIGELEGLVGKEDFDIVHIHSDRDDLGKINYDSNVVKTAVFGRPDEDSKALKTKLSAYFFTSKSSLYRFKSCLGDVSIPTRVIHNPVPVDEFSNREENFKQDLEIEENFVIGKIGRSDEFKWANLTLNAFEELRAAGLDVALVLVNPPEGVREKIESEGLDHVYYKEDIPVGQEHRFYNTIDVLTHSSEIGESFGYVLAEAMASETPVVVNSTPMEDNAQIELVDNGKNGFVTSSLSGYVSAVSKLEEDKELRQAFGRRGREKIINNYSSDKITPELEEIYKKVLSESLYPEEINWGEEYNRRLYDIQGDQDLSYRIAVLIWYVSSTINGSYPYLRYVNKAWKKIVGLTV